MCFIVLLASITAFWAASSQLVLEFDNTSITFKIARFIYFKLFKKFI